MSILMQFVLALVLFLAGWTVNGFRLDGEIADLKREKAEESVRQKQAVLNDIETATRNMQNAVQGAQIDLDGFANQMASFRKEFKDAKNANPLPVDCKPDAVRVHALSAAARAVDQALLGRNAGGGLQGDRQP